MNELRKIETELHNVQVAWRQELTANGHSEKEQELSAKWAELSNKSREMERQMKTKRGK